jgi:rfaE bifunctional protein kinase chain/domain
MMTTSAPTPAIAADAWLDTLLQRIAGARIAVFGDCCLDAYWWLDEDHTERSLETGLPVTRVERQRYGLGAAGNAAVNARALGASVELVGVIGDDHFGRLLRDLAAEAGIGCEQLLAGGDGWQTMVYAKPISQKGEAGRFDFGGGNRLDELLIDRLVAALETVAADCEAVIINQQVAGVLNRPELVARINSVIAGHPDTRFIVDVRDGADAFRGAALKINQAEAAALLGRSPDDEASELAQALQARLGQAVFMTRGPRGLLLAEADGCTVIPGILNRGPVDPVGAGDAAIAAIASALAVGATPAQAARLANFAATVTVGKLQTTGTASPTEIRDLAAGADFLHEPELAEEPRRARYLNGSEIELVHEIAPGGIVHAIFDHDGTISTLRQGWEAVMEPMMLRAVLGARHDDAPAGLFREVQSEVRSLIDRTTGIQTLAQMVELQALVRRFCFVPEAEILDHFGYKKIYNDALLAQIHGRVAKLEAGILAPADFIIRGAVELLEHLHARGVHIHLASGTDQDDVIAEAQALGYAGLFTGIHGAVGSLAAEAKRDVMDRIMRENGIDGAQLMVVGDGPVEMREGRRRGACCVGIASDEPRRYGLDLAKRSRLIRAGADLIVGDFTERHHLLPLLGLA